MSASFYSNKYTISASYTTGSARKKITYSDVDSATSALKTEVKTNKFIWNDANIRRWKNEQRVSVVLSFVATGVVDIVVTKGYASGALAAALSITMFAGNMASAGTVTETKNIYCTPIKGWGYQIKLVPYSGGYTRYLLIYDEKGKLYNTINWGKVPVSTISSAVH